MIDVRRYSHALEPTCRQEPCQSPIARMTPPRPLPAPCLPEAVRTWLLQNTGWHGLTSMKRSRCPGLNALTDAPVAVMQTRLKVIRYNSLRTLTWCPGGRAARVGRESVFSLMME